jgi:hypothetical protein
VEEEIYQEDEVHRALSDEIARLTGKRTLTIVEFPAGGTAVTWRVRRDENGTPLADRRPVEAAVLRDPGALYRLVDPAFIVRTGIVRTGDESAAEPLAKLPDAGRVPAYQCRIPLDQMLREAIRLSPLVVAYELALLEEAPGQHHGPGRLELIGQPLFPIGASHGDKVLVRVHVEPTGSDETCFAVVARDPRSTVPPKDQELAPVQIQSAVVPPGTWELTAELARPGRVVFHGLPVELSRPASPSPQHLVNAWEDIKRRVPERLTRTEPVHLICLIEVCGGSDLLQLRIDRLVKLVNAADAASRQLAVTVVAYGPHSVTWAGQDEAPSVRAWAAPADRAEHVLQELAVRRPDEREYLRAAQLECALGWLAGYLSDREGRPVIVTAGGRPPHPHRMDPRTQIIPCPDRVNWRPQLDRLAELGTTFGVLRDKTWQGDIWLALGQKVTATVDDPVDMPDFAAALGLHETGQAVPLPLIAG